MATTTARRHFDVVDPATGASIESLESAGPDDGIAAVDAAAAAAGEWAARAPRERGEILRRAFDLMIARTDEIARLIVSEMGKPLAEARGEATYAAEFLRWFSEEAVRANGDYAVAPSGANRMLVAHAADRDRAADHAVELPGRHGHAQARPGARRRAARSCSSRPRRRR